MFYLIWLRLDYSVVYAKPAHGVNDTLADISMRARTHAHTHKDTRTHTYIYIHTHTHTNEHTHTHAHIDTT